MINFLFCIALLLGASKVDQTHKFDDSKSTFLNPHLTLVAVDVEAGHFLVNDLQTPPSPSKIADHKKI